MNSGKCWLNYNNIFRGFKIFLSEYSLLYFEYYLDKITK